MIKRLRHKTVHVSCKYLFTAAIFFNGAIASDFLPAADIPSRLTIQENASRILRISLSIPPPVFLQQKINGQNFDVIQLDGFALQHRPGQPATPTLSYLLILPPEGNFQLRFTVTPGLRVFDKNLLPSLQPELDPENNSVEYVLTKPSREGVASPSVRLIETGVWRGFRLGRLEIVPLQFEGGALQFFSEIDITVEFDAGPSIASRPFISPADGIENTALRSALNFAVARHWRVYAPVSAMVDTLPYLSAPGAIKMAVRFDGWYSVSYRMLDSLGLNPATLNPSTLQIWNKGAEIPLRLVDDGDGQFEAGEAIEFFGERLAGENSYYHDYSDENIYWLISGETPGKRLAQRSVTAVADPAPATANYFFARQHFEEDVLYYHGDNDAQIFSSLTSPGETWIWRRLVGGESFVTSLNLGNPAVASAPLCSLRVRVRGTTVDPVTPSHHLRFLINNNTIGEVYFDDTEELIYRAAFPNQWLRDGSNTFQLLSVNTGARINQIYLDWIELGYWRQYIATANSLTFREPQNASGVQAFYRVGNFTSDQILLFDRQNRQMLTGFSVTASAPGQFQIAFVDSATGGREYFVLTSQARRTPARIWADVQSDWRSNVHAADYILVAPAEFRQAAERLAQHRRQHRGRPARDQREIELASGSMRVAVVEIEDIYDEFNFGIPHPEAIRAFLRRAYSTWQKPAPTFVCFFGDASLDPKRNAITSFKRNFIFSYGNPASDNRLVCFDGPQDFLPELIAGRIPVETPAQAQAVVDKIIFYETDELAEWNKTFIFLNGGI
ncbi:MAG: C25 family cysteine peptidase, partial [candidate division KSB1 bacterium]|nr:C25 family cysteine peptidase [candidate division KSB1 bacterium]